MTGFFDPSLAGTASVESWDAVTSLYPIAPADFANWGREGLVSFLIRLAGEHLVNPRSLIQDVLAEIDPYIRGIAKNRFYLRDSRTINGSGGYARVFSSVVERATGCASLTDLTMLSWQHVLPENGEAMLAKQPKWCAECLGEQALMLGYSYRPLVWSLALYENCARHGLRLQERCPSCGATQPFLPKFPYLSHCMKCGGSLLALPGATAESKQTFLIEESLFSMLQQPRSDPPSLQTFRENLRKLIEERAQGNKASFCRELGWDAWAVHAWLRKGKRPCLQRLVDISVKHHIAISDLVCASVQKDISVPRTRLSQYVRRVGRKRRPQLSPAERARIEKLLLQELEGPATYTIAELGRTLGMTRSTLKYWFPTVIARIGERSRVARVAKAGRSKDQRLQVLSNVLRELVGQGIWPTKRLVDKKLRDFGLALVRSDLAVAYQQFIAQIRQRNLSGVPVE